MMSPAAAMLCQADAVDPIGSDYAGSSARRSGSGIVVPGVERTPPGLRQPCARLVLEGPVAVLRVGTHLRPLGFENRPHRLECAEVEGPIDAFHGADRIGRERLEADVDEMTRRDQVAV